MDITLAEIQAILKRGYSVMAWLATIDRRLRHLGYGIGKALRAAEQDRPDAAQKRRLWQSWQRFMHPVCFVFLDDTGHHHGQPLWLLSHQRLVAAVPSDHWCTTTFVWG